MIAALGCGDTVANLRASASRHGTLARGDVVSTINGVGIGAEAVQRLARAGGLSPRAALARLQAEELLAEEAEQRGYGSLSETSRLARQALVQELLERDIEAERVDDAEITRAYAAARARFDIPPLRAATHVLAVVPKQASAAQENAARAFAEAACRELRAAADPAAVLESIKARTSEGLQIKVEALPAFPDDGRFVPEFSRAVFAMSAPGVVPEPVHTIFGWHAIVVSEIRPATAVSLAEARAELQRQLETQLRRRKIDSMLATLRSQTPIQYAATLRQTLDALDL